MPQLPTSPPTSVPAAPTTAAVRLGLEGSLWEGAYSTIMATLTGGIFLTGLTLFVGASNFQIGLLSTLTTLSATVQMAGSFLIERVGSRQKLSIATGIAARVLLLPVALLPLLALGGGSNGLVWSLIILIALSNLFGSICGVAWLSWMKDLVPENEKGSYFSRRSLLCGALGLIISLAAGKVFDCWQMANPSRWGKASGFGVLFVAGAIFGLLAFIYLGRMPEPPMERSQRETSPWASLSIPFRDRNFCVLMMGYAFWTFAIYVAAPFFGVYMLKQLGLSYTAINILACVSGVACLAATHVSGRMTDRFGNKPVLLLCIFGNAFFPFLMCFTVPSGYALLIAAHLLGVFAAGLGLGANNILLKLSPRENSATYLAVFSAMSAVAATLGPLVGGVLMKAFQHFSLDLGIVVLDDIKIVFLAAFGLRLSSLVILAVVQEPKAKPVGQMIRAIWHEVNLNPFEGIGQVVQQWLGPPAPAPRRSRDEFLPGPELPTEMDESLKKPRIEDGPLPPYM